MKTINTSHKGTGCPADSITENTEEYKRSLSMKKKTVFGAVLLVLFVLQSQTVFAQSYDDRQTTNLRKAIDAGNVADARKALERRADVNSRNSQGETPLYTAIRNGNLEMVRLLLEKGADINSRNNNDYTPLLAAVLRENLEMVRFLLERGANFYAGKNGLAEVARRGNFEMVRLLIERGVDINNRHGDDDRTALHFAVIRSQPTIVQYLVESGINVNARDNEGKSALNIAYDKGEMEIYNYLKANGAIDYEPRQVVQQSTPAPAPAPTPATPTLRPGRYACSGTNVTMEIQSPLLFVTLYSGYSTVGNGSYKINGNTIIITISQANDVIKHMRGMTYAYTIVSDTSFSGGGETWYRR